MKSLGEYILASKVTCILDMYRGFDQKREFKRYLHGRSDAGTTLVFKFRSGTHGLNEELRRHSDGEGKT